MLLPVVGCVGAACCCDVADAVGAAEAVGLADGACGAMSFKSGARIAHQASHAAALTLTSAAVR